MLSDPAATAWICAGRPDIEPAPSPDAPCGRCADPGPTVPSSRIISERFTAFDTWPYGSRRLCPACAWAYSRAPRAQLSMLITTNTVGEYPHPSDLQTALSAPQGLCTSEAAVAPVIKRRHLLPTAQWAHLATDGLVVRWDATAAARLRDLSWLRGSVGASWPQLGRTAPPHRLLTSQPADQWDRIITAWENLAPWRTIPPLWSAAQAITRPAAGSPDPR